MLSSSKLNFAVKINGFLANLKDDVISSLWSRLRYDGYTTVPTIRRTDVGRGSGGGSALRLDLTVHASRFGDSSRMGID